ncbi:lipopolysaccharide biosynthesis protein [Bradyrhizobium sp. SSUT112]|uniref:lipopolysaccharide biosynthesis protein n=1 Tax=Bradyrhizobium sp. SSUT112 TaxID=3040604 RepID=UPI00244B3815|nr:lipopolysaccharide biosynthesis protein [Bradyrhizobium sp. SSUT112]MDH2356819.1 lipopolysaccharide biosynthesis protein [Bradyrhizobium sp. SSUT112]
MSSDPGQEIFVRDTNLPHVQSATVRGSFAILVSQISRLVIQFGTQLILARLLFPSDFGLLAMISPILSFVAIINDVGFSQILIQKRSIFQLQVSNLFWINLALGSTFGVTLAACAPLVAYVFGEPKVLSLTVVMALMIPLGMLSLHPNALLARQLRFATVARIEVAAAAAGSAVTLVCASAGFSYWSLAIGQLAATTVTVVMSWSFCGWKPSWPTRSLSVRAEFAFGRNVTATNLSVFATTMADKLLIGIVQGPVQLGLYDRSYRLLIQPLSQLMLPLNRVAVPLLSRVLHDPVTFRQTYLFMVQLLAVATMPVLAVCIADGTIVVRFLLGSRWEPAAPMFAWFCVGGLTSGVYSSAAWLFIARDRTGPMVKYWTSSALIGLASYAVGIFWGAVGVTMVAAVSFVAIQTPLVLYGALRDSPIGSADVVNVLVPPALAAAVTFAVIRFTPQIWSASDLLTLVGWTTASYGLLLILLLATKSGRGFLSRCLKTAKMLKLQHPGVAVV